METLEEILREGLLRHPHDWPLRRELIRHLEKQGRRLEAVDLLLAEEAKVPALWEEWEPLLNLFSAHAPERAEAFWNDSLSRYLNDARTHRLAAAVQRRLGNRPKAAAHYTLAVSGQPDLADPEFEHWLGHRPEEAKATKEKALPSPPAPGLPMAGKPRPAPARETGSGSPGQKTEGQPIKPLVLRPASAAPARILKGRSLPIEKKPPRPGAGWLPVLITVGAHVAFVLAGVYWIIAVVRSEAPPPDFVSGASVRSSTSIKTQKSEVLRERAHKSTSASAAALHRIVSVNVTSVVLPEAEMPELTSLDFSPSMPGFGTGTSLGGGGAGGMGKGGGAGGGAGAGAGLAQAFIAKPPLFQLFGTEVKARKLGVVLDVSSSMYGALPRVIDEVARSFPEATLVITRGCGLDNSKRREEGETTAQRLRGSEFTKDDIHNELSARPEGKELLVTLRKHNRVWFVPARNRFHTMHAFEQLLKEKIEAIYWFADFQDELAAGTVKELAESMVKKRIPLYAQSASKTKRSLANMEMVGDLLAKATGGGIIPMDAKPSRETAVPAGQADEAAVSRALQPKP